MASYKEKLLANLDRAGAKERDDLDTALDNSKSSNARLAALKRIGSISDDTNAGKAMELIDDHKTNEKIRALLLQKVAQYFGDEESFLEKLTLMLNDQSLSSSVREAAFKGLQTNSFSSLTFQSRRPVYLAALRTLVDDKNDRLRESAIEYLAMNRDEYVQRRLVEGLENPRKKITKSELAIQYLAYDLHADHYPILRKLAKKPPNKKTRMEALRNLSADAASIPLLSKILEDKEEDAEVRHLCGVALQRLDSEKFSKIASKIIKANGEHEELKIALVNTKLHTLGNDLSSVKTDLKKALFSSTGRKAKRNGQRLSSLIDQHSKR